MSNLVAVAATMLPKVANTAPLPATRSSARYDAGAAHVKPTPVPAVNKRRALEDDKAVAVPGTAAHGSIRVVNARTAEKVAP